MLGRDIWVLLSNYILLGRPDLIQDFPILYCTIYHQDVLHLQETKGQWFYQINSLGNRSCTSPESVICCKGLRWLFQSGNLESKVRCFINKGRQVDWNADFSLQSNQPQRLHGLQQEESRSCKLYQECGRQCSSNSPTIYLWELLRFKGSADLLLIVKLMELQHLSSHQEHFTSALADFVRHPSLLVSIEILESLVHWALNSKVFFNYLQWMWSACFQLLYSE